MRKRLNVLLDIAEFYFDPVPPSAPSPSERDLRDRFAMAALSACEGWMADRMESYPEMARRCYAMADAMLKIRAGK